MAWFALDLIGIPGLVTRDDWFGLPGLLGVALLVVLIGYWRHWKFVPYFALIVLGVWSYFQYTAHWQGFIFGASADQLKRYYALFAGMYRFFPESGTRIIPDAYHTILGLLLVINLVFGVLQVGKRWGALRGVGSRE